MSNEQTQNPNTAQQIDYCYEVLTTIKFRGVVIKPQAFLQLSDAEAAPLIAKGYISAEQVLPPNDTEVERCESGAPDCGPVEFYDSEGVPLCRRCYDSLSTDTSPAPGSAQEAGGSHEEQEQAAAGGADGASDSAIELQGAQSADTEAGDQGSESTAEVTAEGDAAKDDAAGTSEQAPGAETGAGAAKPAKTKKK